MAVVVGELQPGTLGGDDRILERLLFEAITKTEGVETVELVVRLHELAERARAGDEGAAALIRSEVAQLDRRAAGATAKALLMRLQLANLCEERERVRRLQTTGWRRASLEQDIAAIHEFGPDLAIGTTPVVQHAKERSIPSLYFTNLISARPLMGPAGAGSLATVVNAALANKGRFDRMTEFFEGVGTGHAAGVWEDTPQDRPEFKARYAKTMAASRAAEEAVGT